MIFKIVGKSLKKNFKLLLGVCVLLVISATMITIAKTNRDAYVKQNDKFFEESNIEDFRLWGNSIIDNITDYYSIKEIDKLEKKYNVDLERVDISKYDNDDRQFDILKYNTANKMNEIQLIKGRMPKNKGEVVINERHFKNAKYKIGDNFKVGEEKYEIVGYGYFPTHINPASSMGMKPDPKKTGQVLMNSDSFKTLKNNSQLIFTGQFNEKLSKDKKYELMKEMKEDETRKVNFDRNIYFSSNEKEPLFLNSTLLQDNMNIYGFKSGVENDGVFLGMLGNVIAIISIFLTVLFYNSILKSQRREMGILKAEGVHHRQIGRNFTIWTLIYVIPSMLIGVGIGLMTLPLFGNLYMEQFNFPLDDRYLKYVGSSLTTIGILLIILIVLINIFSLRKNLKQNVLLLIKNVDKEKIPKFNFTKKLKFVSFKTRYRISLLLRNFSKTFFLAVVVMISSFLILLSSLALSGLDLMFARFDKTINFDYQAIYPQPYVETEGDHSKDRFLSTNLEITGFNLKDNVKEKEAKKTLKADKKKEENSMNVNAFDIRSNRIKNLDRDENLINITKYKDGIVLSPVLAKKYNIEVGDKIITEFNNQGKKKKVELRVNAIHGEYLTGGNYTDINFFRDKLDIGKVYSGEFGDGDNYKKIYEKNSDAIVVKVSNLIDDAKDMTKQIYLTLTIIAIISGIVTFVIINSISNVIVESNKKAISMMKVLGYKNSEVKSMTISSYKWIVILVYFATLPLINFLIQTIMRMALKSSDIDIPLPFSIKYVLIGFAIIYGVYMLAISLSYRGIKKIKVSESLKADE